MERSQVAIVAGVVVAVLVAGVGAAFVFGLVPGNGGKDVAPPTGGNRTNGSANVALNFTLHGRTECGMTCRRVNATITNTGNETVENVEFAHELFTRTESGEPDEQVWTGTVEPGTIPANATVVSKFDIEVGIGAGRDLQENGGLLYSTGVTPQGNVSFENVVLDD